MRVFIYEYICGGGLAGRPLPESLAREGWAMLASIVEDFARVEGCEVVTTLDGRFARRPLAARWIERIDGDSERCVIERLSAECDWSLVIAPEFDGILLDRVRWVEAAGGRLLGPSSSAVAITADKLVCGQLLERSGVAAVVGQVLNLTDGISGHVGYPAVLKPRDGAGSQRTFLVSDSACLDSLVSNLKKDCGPGEFLLQPYVPGNSVSVSFLIGPKCQLPLLAGEQSLTCDGRFQYLGGRLPLSPDGSRRAVALATRAVAAVPGLNGFVGVDLVLGPKQGLQIANCQLPIANCEALTLSDIASLGDGNSILSTQYSVPSTQYVDVVIEVNPRLTTSYVGLRPLCEDNLAKRIIACCSGQSLPPIRWKPGTVSFTADGRLT